MKPRFKQVTLKVSDVKPNPKNPRVDLRPGMPVYESLKKSIEHFEYVDPIIWNKTTGMIVSGHQRMQVMKDIAEEKGEPFETVDVMQVEMTEAEQDSFMIAVNKITGIWDNEKLEALFRELSEEDLEYTGYTKFEIDNILDDRTEDLIDTDMEEEYGESVGETKFKITIVFDSEEDRDEAFSKLKEDGYNVRK